MSFFFATAEGKVDDAKALLAARVDIDFRDYEQRCPLHVAPGFGNLDMIQILIDRGASVNVIDHWGRTPLSQCELGGHFKAEQLLKDNGAMLQKARMQGTAKREKWEVNRSDVKIGDTLSETLKSSVHRATWQGIDVVAKFCLGYDSDKKEDLEALEAEMLHEIKLLAPLRHPDLVMFLGCCLQEAPIMFISQFMAGGDLERYYASRKVDGAPRPVDGRKVNVWGRSILRALSFLHGCAQPIIHRDLKPLNILLTESLEVKVADFGVSKVVDKLPRAEGLKKSTSVESLVIVQTLTGGVGSFRYMAPEIARHVKYSEKADIYAFGLILYFISCGQKPFRQYQDAMDVLTEFSEGKEPRPNASDCPKVFRPIMVAAWNPVPKQRPTACDLIERLIEAVGSDTGNKCTCTSM